MEGSPIEDLGFMTGTGTDPVVVTDKKGFIVFFSEGAEDVLGYRSSEIIGKHVSVCYKDGKEEAKKIMGVLNKEGKTRDYKMTLISKDGKEIPYLLLASLLRDSDGNPVGTAGIWTNITERKRLENELRETKEFLENVIESSIDAIVTADKKGFVTFVNNAAQIMIGARTDKIGTHLSGYYLGGMKEAQKINCLLKERGKLQSYETIVKGRGDKVIPVISSISLLKDTKGDVVGTLGVMKDITERKKLEQELKRLSITDDLTGLYNQRHFYDELKKEIERAKRHKRTLSLLLFDIDGFKHYNDTYGHLEGDMILQKTGEIIVLNIRENVDSGYRYGGDEFIVVLPETDKNQAFSVGERIRRSFSDIGLDGVTVSIGLAEYQNGLDLKTFISRADKAMFSSKHLGGDRITVC